MNTKILVLLAALLPLAACSSMNAAQRAERARFAARAQAAALAPVSHINLVTDSLYAWRPINDHQIVAFLTPSRAYLLDLPKCPGLEQTPSILISSRMGQVSTNFDSVTTSMVGVPCRIEKIRPLDLQRMRAPDRGVDTNVEVKPRPAQDGSSHQS